MKHLLPNHSNVNFDFIGDIHGHADKLKELLAKLGYTYNQKTYLHPDGRKVVFMGDLIDRGPKILEVLEIIKSMVDNGNAFTIIGNHEYNFICYFTAIDGKYLRSHSQKNRTGIRETIEAFKNDENIIQYYVNWFRTLPIYIDHPYFRVIHAQWNLDFVKYLINQGINDLSNSDFLEKSVNPNEFEYKLINCLLKGQEIKMSGVPFLDKYSKKRESYRIKWWIAGSEIPDEEFLFDFQLPANLSPKLFLSKGYPENDVPVFFGHYCLKNSQPILQQNNCCCLDLCISKGGKLLSYRFNGEQALTNENFIMTV